MENTAYKLDSTISARTNNVPLSVWCTFFLSLNYNLSVSRLSNMFPCFTLIFLKFFYLLNLAFDMFAFCSLLVSDDELLAMLIINWSERLFSQRHLIISYWLSSQVKTNVLKMLLKLLSNQKTSNGQNRLKCF